MDKMRSSTAPILWVLVIAFGLLFMLQDTQVFDAVMAGPRTLGEVEGRPITNEQFNQRLNAFTEQHRQQTGNPPNREQLAYYQEIVWDQMIVELALQAEMEKLGIEVTEQEIIDAVFGDNPDPIIRQIFGRPDGSIDRATLRAMAEAPEAAADWVIIENQIRERRLQEKVNKYVESAIFVSDKEVEQEYIRNNTRANVSYVRFPFSEITEDELSISNSDIRRHYRDNRSQFEQDKTWRFRFVSFSKAPTQQDTLDTIEMMNNFRAEFADAQNDSLFLEFNFSQSDYNNEFRTPDEVRKPYYSVFDLEVGEVSEPVVDNNVVSIFKKTGDQRGDQTFVRARKIQLNFTEANRDERREQAAEIAREIRSGADFSDYLAQSDDSQSAVRNGDTGFFAREAKPAAAATQLFNAGIGDVVGPLEVDNSFRVYEVTGRTNREVSFVNYSRLIEADPSRTVQAQQILADDFREFSALDGFEYEADRNEYVVQEATATEGTAFIPGMGESRLIKRALAYTRSGDITETIELDDQFLIIKVDEVRPAGVRPLDEVRSQVESAVKSEKRREIMMQRLRAEHSAPESLEALAEATNRGIQTASNVRMNSTTVSGAGREPAIVGAFFAAAPEVLKGPVKGENAAFFFIVTERTEANLENLSSSERDRIRTRLHQQKSRAFTEKLVDQLKEQVTIKDHRRSLGVMQ